MKKDDLLYFYRNFQIIDVTEKCNFEWLKEPEPCKAYLEVSDASGDFTEGETIQGQSSGATATVFSSYVDGGRVYVENVSGTFQEGETIQGQSSGQTATVDGFVPERSYPDNIIKGTFPDSMISKDINEYCDIITAKAGSGSASEIKIIVPDEGLYLVNAIVAVLSGQGDLNFEWSFRVGGRVFNCGDDYGGWSLGNTFLRNYEVPPFYRDSIGLFYLRKHPDDPNQMGCIHCRSWQNNKGVIIWRYRLMRVYKVLL